VKFTIVTFGCRVNQADSLHLEESLRRQGAEPATAESADLVIVNTCSVTASADQGARQTILRIARANPSARIVATGCYASREPAALAALPNVVRVVRNDDKLDIAGIAGITTAQRYAGGEGSCGAAIEPGLAGRTAFTLRVQTGCDQACAYCIIPTTRGRGRSVPIAAIVSEAGRIVDSGFKEIALTGVHLGSYGRDLETPSSLFELLCALTRIDGDVTFRISSLEPMDCTPEIVELVASSTRLAPHFHLPLQHGSDGMLRVMRRPYTASYFRDLVELIRSRMPHASIGSDLIVGFPGETDAHFDEMRAVLDRLPLTHLHVFPYSDRPGTEASALHPKVDGGLTRERGRQLRAIGSEMSRRFRESQVGSVRRALVVDDGWSAVTDNYLKLRLDQQHARNEWIAVPVS
jgi:threonylcarbamoyladenosine tRNA methylthiotransferase MtaB